LGATAATAVLNYIGPLSEIRGKWKNLKIINSYFAFTFPSVYRLMRGGTLTPEDPDLQNVRTQLSHRIQTTIESGVKSGELTDPCPALTAQYIMSFIRGALLYPPPDLTRESLTSHMLHVLRRGIERGALPC
ncbi:MAG: hypothetical protein NTV94_02645, partial [Planctomycetota bacterium]|nr:hypothetical protein [Planctomycetota bacterium]